MIEGAIDSDLLHSVSAVAPPLYSPQELQQLANHCRTNVLALVQGATPNYYLPGCNDANVQGVVLALELTSRGASPQFARLAMRPGMPLQSTLFQLAEAAARWISSVQIPREDVSPLRCNVAVLYDSALHGTVARPDLRGVDPRRRALVVAEHGRYAWTYAPDNTPEQLLETAARKSQVFDPQVAGVFSFAVDASVDSFLVTNIPRPQAGPSVRRPAVAGMFYPAASRELQQMVTQLVADKSDLPKERWPAILVPHAGLQYSGRIAAQVFQRIAIPDRVVILAPKHTRLGTPWAVAPHTTWSLPGVQMESDPEWARRLSEAIPRLELDAAAHQDEHAIEVQLPLLAHLAPQTRVVGVTIGEGGLEDCCEFARQLAQVLRAETNPPLLVISTDLNHYATEEENRRLDHIALGAIEQLDPRLLFHTVRQHDISMCGMLPAVIVMETLRHLDLLRTCTQIAYATSADAGGSRERVVGYAGLLLG